MSPREANRMIGDWIARRSNASPLALRVSPDHRRLPTNRLRVIHSISSRFIRK
ncbi:hypothetical protein D3C81_1505790 [compost metagenome]